MTPRRTFVVLYAGREGSSALIDQLSAHESICVPLQEHLDKHNLERVVGHPERQIGRLLDRVFTTGEVPGKESDYAGEPVLGFKWRPFGGSEAVAALRRSRCRVVYLYRSRVMRRALSYALRPRHTQFRLSSLDPGSRRAALEQLRSERFVADPSEVAENISRYTLSKKLVWNAFCAGAPDVATIDYERFLDSPLAVLNELLVSLDVEPFSVLPPTRFVKVMSTDIESQCDNLDEIRNDPDVQQAVERYEHLIHLIEHATAPPATRRRLVRRLAGRHQLRQNGR